MKKILFTILILTCSAKIVFSQKPGEDAILNSHLNSSLIHQVGAENRILFLDKDNNPDKTTNDFSNLTLRQYGFNNTLILSEPKNVDARLDIRQEGFGNKLFVEDVSSPLQIRQTGGMELSIRGTNFMQLIFP